METLGELVTPADVALDVDAVVPDTVLSVAAEIIARNHGLPAAAVRTALAARERLGCTALGHGVALPHARMAALDRPAAAFVRTRSPLDFGAFDGKPVSCFLVLVVPAEAAEVHLKLLANAATLLNDPSFRAAIRGAGAATDITRLFAEWPLAPD
jgi:PTS system nitrogen regulatory IIA component